MLMRLFVILYAAHCTEGIVGPLLNISDPSFRPCPPALPAFIAPAGGDPLQQADGVWYMYRQMGVPNSFNVIINITSVGRTVDPSDPFRSAQLQWWQWTQRLNSSSKCQQQFWTGTYSGSGRLVGEQGVSDDNYIMRPTSYVTLYHNFINLLVLYSCSQPMENGLCADPVIYALSRKPPNQMSTSDQEGADNRINSAISQYCVFANDLFLQGYCKSCGDCDFTERPFCIGQYISGMKTVASPSSQLPITLPTTTQRITTKAMPAAATTTGVRKPSYYVIPAARATAPLRCDWPNFIPSQGQITPSDSTGFLYVYRKLYQDEYSLINPIAFVNDLGPSPSTWNNTLTRAVWTFYAGYNTTRSATCTYGYSVGSIEPSGLVTGAMLSYHSPNNPITLFPLNLMILHRDKLSTLYYGCVVPNLETGICKVPYILHGTRKNPLELDKTEVIFLESVENLVFGKHGCGAFDVPEMQFVTGKPPCPPGPLLAPECIQDRIAGYNETLVNFIKSLFFWN